MKFKIKNGLPIIIGLVFVSLVLECQSAPSTTDEVVFYEDAHFDGDRLFLKLGKGCYTMEKDWDNRISSLDLQGNCVMAYDKTDCRGTPVTLAPGSAGADDLKSVRFDDMLTSITVCSRDAGKGRVSMDSDDSLQDGPEIWKVGLEEHNRYRHMHGVPPLNGDRQLHEDAQQHADYLAKNNRFEVSPGTKYGENLATSYKKDKLDAVREVIKRWYDKVEYFNFRDPEGNKDRPKSAQFSSVIWKSTTHAGIGVARNNIENKWVVVVFYDPAATRSRYRENVPPVTRSVQTEGPSLLRTSPLSNFYPSRSRYFDGFA